MDTVDVYYPDSNVTTEQFYFTDKDFGPIAVQIDGVDYSEPKFF